MNKKIMIVALLATLSTLGYAFETVGGNVENLNTTNHGTWNQTTMDKINSNVNSIVSKTDENFTNVQNQLNNKVNTGDVYTKTDADSKFASKDEINGKVNQSDFDALQGQVNTNRDKIAELDNQLFGEGTTGGVINNLQGQITGLNDKLFAEGTGVLGNLEAADKNLADKDTELQGQITGLNDKLFAEGTGVLGNLEVADNKLQVQIDKNKTDIKDLQADNKKQDDKIAALDKNKVDKNTYEEDKKAQTEIDASQQNQIGALAGQIGEQQNINLAQQEEIDKNKTDIKDLQADNKKQDDKIAALDKNKVDKEQYNKDQENVRDAINGNTQQIADLHKQDTALKEEINSNKAEQDKVNAEQKKNNDNQQKYMEDNRSYITNLQQTSNNHEARITHLEDRVDKLDNKMNKGLSLMAAMNAVDFQSVQAGEMAIGAGVGHYGNAQSVAVGVAYAPTDNFNVNAKYSVTAGDIDSFAVGAGATYKFKIGR